MIDVKKKRCIVAECPEEARFNTKNKPAIYCETHKQDGMIDVKSSKKCLSCNRGARYNFAGEPALYCADHKQDEMVNVKIKKCDHDGCPTCASYGPVYGPAVHCAKHKGHNEYKDRNPECLQPDCMERPTHTDHPTDNYPLYCILHAPDGARELNSAACKICKIEAIVSTKSMLCSTCEFGAVFGNMHNVKEERMATVLKTIDLIPTAHNQPIGESKRRPDFYFNCGTFAIILEVDENQHARDYTVFKKSENADPESHPVNQYSCECEFARMVNLHNDINLPRTITSLPNIPTIFVRYNPDKYIDAQGKKQIASRGCVRDRKVANFIRWLINYYTAHAHTLALPEGLYAVYLYYDGFDEQQDDAFSSHSYRVDFINSMWSHWDIFAKDEQEQTKGKHAQE